MLVVLGVVVLFTMLGFMGLSLAAKDSQVAGATLDIRSKESAARGGLQLAVGRLTVDGDSTALLLNQFIADSSASSPRQWIDFTASPFSLRSTEPGFYQLNAADKAAAKVRILALDIGGTTGRPSDGVKITLECTGRGRNGDVHTVVGTYRFVGLDVLMATNAGGTDLRYAVYVNGDLSSTNFGSKVTGNVYVSGDVSTNSMASLTVTGDLRVGGDFKSNAPVIDSGNAVIGGDICTNGSAPMTFLKNLVVKGGIKDMNASLTVGRNLEIGGVYSGGPVSWNSGALLNVGQQLWVKKECREIGAPVTVGGSAFFDSCAHLTATGTSSFQNLYVGRSGNPAGNTVTSGTVNVAGVLGVFNSSTTNEFQTSGANLAVTGNALFKQPVNQSNGGSIVLGSNAQFWQGISWIGNNTWAGGIRVAGKTFLYSPSQSSSFSGKASFGDSLVMGGALDPWFGWNNTSRWFFLASAPRRRWYYENSGPVGGWGSPDPRVTNSLTNNWGGYLGAPGSRPRPALLFTAPTPVAPTAYTPDHAYTTDDLDLSPTACWNRVDSVNASAFLSSALTLTDAMCAAAGANAYSWTASDFNKIYDKYKNPSGWLVLRIGSGCSLGSIDAPGGTWAGKAIWVIEKTINVNGHWPASASSSAVQMVYVHGSGSLGAFGSPGNFYGYVDFTNTFNGQMLWGNGTDTVMLVGALHMSGPSSSLTGNGGNYVKVVGDEDVLNKFASAFSNLYQRPAGCGTSGSGGSGGSGSSSGSTAYSKRTLVNRYLTGISLVPAGEFR